MQELSTDLHIEGPDEDKAMMVRQVFVYYGCSEILPGELHDSTIFSGSLAEDFKQFLDVTEDQRLGGTLGGIVVHNNPTDAEVPNEDTSSGELHYTQEGAYRKDHYLITAGHCLVDFDKKLCTPQVVAECNADGDFATFVTTMAITGSERKVIQRNNVVAISGLGLNDSAFAEGGD